MVMHWVRMLCGRTVEHELTEEVSDHIEREVARQLALGVPEDEARRRAIVRTGSIESIKEQVRDERGGRLILDALGDVRIGARGLRRSPGFTAAVVLSLAIGVAGVTAIASVVNAVVMRPLPYPASDRLYLARVAWNEFTASPSAADFLRLREASGDVAVAAAYIIGGEGYTLLGQGEPVVVAGAAVTPEAPRVLGVQPALGRWLAEDDRGTEALISDGLWRSRFGGSPEVLGRPLTFDRGTYAVVGVMPPGFDVPGQRSGDVWVSARIDEPTRRGPYYLQVVLRLAPGVAPDQASARLTTAVAPLLQARYAVEPSWRYRLTSMKDVVVGDTRLTLWLFLAATILVLLIASANVANLMLARGAARAREFALRASLGARRERLVRQLLAESVLLGSCSAVLGLITAVALLRLIVVEAGALIPRAGEVRFDAVTAVVAVGVAIGAALLAGVAPAVWLTGRPMGEAVRSGGRTVTSGPADARIRRAMVVAEVALAFCVLVATALLVKTIGRLESHPPGFDASGVFSFRLVAPPDPYREVSRLNAYLESVDENVRRLPGVTHVAFAESLPPDRLQETNNYTLDGEEPGTPGRIRQDSGIAQWNIVSAKFFDTLRIPVLQGRVLAEGDRAAAPAVAVVSQTFAAKHFPRGDAVGRHLKGGDWDAAAPWITIVGVVGDVPYERAIWGGLAPTVYLPRAQNAGSRWQFVVVRTASASVAADALAGAVQAPDARVPLRDVATMSERLASSTAVPRFRVRLFGVLAAVALTLAVIGIYGILAYQVSQRRKETAIRQALGASWPAILGSVVRSGLGLTAVGVVVGLVAAAGLTRWLAAFLFGVVPGDISAYASATAVLLGAATLASLLPALRAAGTDPLTALREE
jgi:predicted permease